MSEIKIVKVADIVSYPQKYLPEINKALDMAADEAVELGERLKHQPTTVMNAIKRSGNHAYLNVKTGLGKTYIVRRVSA